jgi:hypothetical protein
MRWMDPFYYYGSADKPGINEMRYGAIDFPELAKKHSIEWYRPHSLILGTSRAQIGLDPSHRKFIDGPTYNLAYPGSTMRQTFALFERAVATGEIKETVLAIDFFMFRAARSEDGGSGWFSAFAGLLKEQRNRVIDFWTANLSSAAIKLASNDFLLNSKNFDFGGMRWVMRRDGYNILLNRQSIRYDEMFGLVEASYAKDYTNGSFCLSSKPGESSLGDLRSLVELARIKGVKLQIAISPAHAALWEVIDQAGLWQKWEDWKRDVVRIAAEVKDPGWSVPVFDFSGYNAITTEAVPIGSPEVQMANYWDPSHYKRHVGNMVLDKLLGNDQLSAESEFGTLITTLNIEEHLADIRRDRSAWRARAPEQAARVKGIRIAAALDSCR